MFWVDFYTPLLTYCEINKKMMGIDMTELKFVKSKHKSFLQIKSNVELHFTMYNSTSFKKRR